MPTCTPTRATFFTGRYPSSTNILNAVVQTDLANSEISPYEMTLPKLLKTAGYTNRHDRQMHLTGTNCGQFGQSALYACRRCGSWAGTTSTGYGWRALSDRYPRRPRHLWR